MVATGLVDVKDEGISGCVLHRSRVHYRLLNFLCPLYLYTPFKPSFSLVSIVNGSVAYLK